MKNQSLQYDVTPPLWQRVTGFINIFLLLFHMLLPSTVAAYELVSDAFIEQDVNYNPQFETSKNSNYLFEKSYYVDDVSRGSRQNIVSFYNKLLDFRKSGLGAPTMVPIINGDITIILPIYPLAKLVGDEFVQARLVRSQIYNEINRTLISDTYANETAQINDLYIHAYEYAGTSGNKAFGEKLTRSDVNTFNKNLIWPELRTINGKQVLVPVVHLTDETINNLIVDGNTIDFGGTTTNLNNLVIDIKEVRIRRDNFLDIGGDLILNEGSLLKSDKDLNVLVGGTLQNLSGTLSAQENINIIAGQYTQKTVLHRFATPTTQGSRLGEIAAVTAGGSIEIETTGYTDAEGNAVAGDIIIQGGTVTSGGNVELTADGNIRLLAQATTTVRDETVRGWNENESITTHLGTQINAQDNITLIASGAIEINASTLHADEGVIKILADRGIHIVDSLDSSQLARKGKFGKNSIQEQMFESLAVRSALNAGKGIVLATELGDITLKSADLASTTGTNINAHNGAVNFLMTKEQENYFYHKVHKGTLKIKTTTIQDDVETAVYNEIIGGVKVQATQGITLEVGQYDNGEVQEGMNTTISDLSADIKAINDQSIPLDELKELINKYLAQTSENIRAGLIIQLIANNRIGTNFTEATLNEELVLLEQEIANFDIQRQALSDELLQEQLSQLSSIQKSQAEEDLAELNIEIADLETNGDPNSQLADKLAERAILERKVGGSLNWMQDIATHPDYQEHFNLAYQELISLHKFERTSTLSPAAMAIIAIAVSVALGPGAGVIGQGATLGPVMQAGVLSIANQAAVSLASGNGLEETAKSLFRSDSIKATATAMATAGIMDKFGDSFEFFDNIPEGEFSTLNPAHQFQTIANQSLNAIGNSVIRSGVSTVISGGDLGDFEQSFKSSLQQSAINSLGEYMAKNIGDSFKNKDINNAIRYIAHAGAGCILGTLSAESNGGDNETGCASGAGGAVVGELIADTYRDQTDYEQTRAQIERTDSELKEILGITNIDLNNPSSGDLEFLAANVNGLSDFPSNQERLLQLQATGVDLAKLGAGLAALAAGGDVSIAADTGANAAKNNAFWFVIQGAYLLWKAYELAETAKGVYELGSQLNAINQSDLTEAQKSVQREALIKQLGFQLLGEAVVGKGVAEVLTKLNNFIKKSPFGEKLTKQIDNLIGSFENNRNFAIAGAYKVAPQDSKYTATGGRTNTTVGPNGAKTDVPHSRIPKDEYTDEQWRLLKGTDSAHTIERHGPHLSDEHLILRAKYGYKPDGGGKGVPPRISSKFRDKQSLEEATDLVKPGSPAFQNALNDLSEGKSRLSFDVDAGKSMGYGYRKSQTVLDGVPSTVISDDALVENLNIVHVEYILDKSDNVWKINTMYPTEGL